MSVEKTIPTKLSNPGTVAAEILALLGPQGERLHVRARTTFRGSF